MTKSRRNRIILAGLLLLALLMFAVLLVYLLLLRPPTAEPLESRFIYTRIAYPPSETSWPADATIPIRALATSSSPLVRFELWINGVRLEMVDLTGNANPLGAAREWTWVPGEEGLYNLAVRAVDADGGEQISEPVSVLIHEPVGHVIRIELGEGETAEDVAAAYSLPVEELLPANSEPEGDEPAPQSVYVPQTPFLPTGPVSVPPIPVPDAPRLESAPPGVGQDAPGPEPVLLPPPESGDSLEGDSVGQALSSPMFASAGAPIPLGSGPGAPEVAVGRAVYDCRLQLTITDHSSDEDGFYVYGSRPGSARFELIDTLPANDESVRRVFNRNGYQYSMYSYMSFYVSAFNDQGEMPSEIVSYTELDQHCLRDGLLSNTVLGDAELVIPPFLDAAYVYAAFEGAGDEPDGEWFRIPADPDTFLPASSGAVDLQQVVLDHLPESASFEQSILPRHVRIKMELWGWSGGQLVHVGDYSGVYIPMVLLYGADAESAHSDAGFATGAPWVDELQVYSDSELQSRQFSYVAGDVEFDRVTWQIANAPFPGVPILIPPGLVASGEVQRTSQLTFRGSFNLDLGALLRVPGTYYMRIVPMDGSNPASKTSNTVVIHYGPHGGSPMEPGDHLPPIYDVEILSYNPPVYVEPQQWGCITITETTPGNAIRYPVGATVCPSAYKPEGREGIGNVWEQATSILTQEVAMIREGWDYLANGYDWIFVQAAELVAEGINAISPVDCGPRCQAFIKSALQTAVSSVTGLPPSLPTSGDLIDRGIDGLVDYGVEYVSDQAGGLCNYACQQGVRSLMNEAVDETIELFTEHGPGCVPSELAMMYNRNSLCLPDGVRGEPLLGSVYIPPELIVRVTRNDTGADDLSAEDAGRYELGVSFEILNENRMGEYIRVCQFIDDYDTSTENQELYNNRYRGLRVNNVLQHDGFAPETRAIPWLEPGESVDIPIVPQDLDYNLMNQISDYGAREYDSVCGRELGYVDRWEFQYLYFDGLTQIDVNLYCAGEGGHMGYCGACDYLEVANPSGPYR
ncbi:MAG: hypothetical protein JXA97_11280 [Anaerolineales bacterium]|nr:hypothetical protein [Anaerolineales bacterium]